MRSCYLKKAGMMAIGREIALTLDPVKLAQAVGIDPDDWQKQVLRSNAPRLMLNCSRQVGKSTVSSVLAIHTALYSRALVLLLSPSLRQSQELFRRCLDTYRALGRPVPPTAESALRLELTNGSRIVSLPGTENTVRGLSDVRLLIIDEASRVSDELYKAVRPMLAVSHGRLLVLSTPYGTRGWFYQAWSSDEPWERYQIPATACPRISKEFLQEEAVTLGEWWFAQEYGCEFLDAADSVFRDEDIMRTHDEVEVWTI